MNIQHKGIEIPEDDPFKNGKLQRKQYAEILTKIIKAYPEGFVFSLDSKWGTGKTTFVSMWKALLEKQEYQTLYFNAWVNDFDSNPLVAILSELKTLSKGKSDVAFKSLLTKGAVIAQSVLPALLKAFAKKHIDVEVFTDTIENLTKSAVDILKDEVDEYAKKKKGLIEFKADLEKYVSQNAGDKPLIFFIDELDRCRPNYAVEVLEQIKHFFNVKGIVFVLAIDKQQLGNAIRGFYGSEQIDAEEYLRRFIDIEYSVPEPPTGLFCNYLIDYYQFNEFFNSNARNQHRELSSDRETLINIATSLFQQNSITLRQQVKVLGHARLVLNFVPLTNYLFPDVFFLLVFIRDLKRHFYLSIKNKRLSAQQILDGLVDIFPKGLDKYDRNPFIYLEARLISFYENYVNEHRRKSALYTKDETTGVRTLIVKSSFASEEADTDLLNNLDYIEKNRLSGIKLDVLLNKIDLLENFIVPNA
jgi:hypothetical protein